MTLFDDEGLLFTNMYGSSLSDLSRDRYNQYMNEPLGIDLFRMNEILSLSGPEGSFVTASFLFFIRFYKHHKC